MTTLAICTLIAAAVFAVMIHSIATFRRAGSAARERPLAEVIWAIVPILIIVSTALPAVRMLAAAEEVPQAARQSKPLLATPAIYRADGR